jgi:hypothetical protein
VNAGFLQGGGFAHHIVDLEVDSDGRCDSALHGYPGRRHRNTLVEGQMQGGAVKAWLGADEEYYNERGR